MSAAVADKLAEARKLIERGWTQGDFAFDKSGQEIESRDQEAVCFCALGAISQATLGFADPDADEFNGRTKPFDEAARVLANAIGVRFSHEVARWNDKHGRTQAEVIEAFRKAEALARSA